MTVKELRAQTGLSQSQFAARFRIPVRTLQHWEQGRQEPPAYVVDMIQTILEYKHKEILRARRAEAGAIYEDAIKMALVATAKVDEILNSDKAKLLSTPAFTPEGDVSPEWAEWLTQQKNSQKEK